MKQDGDKLTEKEDLKKEVFKNIEKYPLTQRYFKEVVENWIENPRSKPLEFSLIRWLYCGYEKKFTRFEKKLKIIKEEADINDFLKELKDLGSVSAETSGKFTSLEGEMQTLIDFKEKYRNLQKISEDYVDLKGDDVLISVKTILSIQSNNKKIADCIEASLISNCKNNKLHLIEVIGGDKIGDSFRKVVFELIRTGKINKLLDDFLYSSQREEKLKTKKAKIVCRYPDNNPKKKKVIIEVKTKNKNRNKIKFKFRIGEPSLGKERERDIPIYAYRVDNNINCSDDAIKPTENELNYTYFKKKLFTLVEKFDKGYDKYKEKEFVAVLNVVYDFKHENYISSNRRKIKKKFRSFLEKKRNYDIFIVFLPGERTTINEKFNFKI